MSKEKKVVLITGCSSGIGFETAKILANQFHILATARKQSDVQKLQELGFESYKLDVTSQFDVEHIFQIIKEKHKNNFFAVFNNAGYGQPGALEDLPIQALKEQFETNFFGLFAITKKAIELFRQNNHGIIIQHSSVLGLISLRFRGAYNASKYAIEGLSDTLRLELSNTNIKIVTLNTGPIESDFRKNAMQKFYQWIDIKNSNFQKTYQQEVEARLHSKDDSFFTKPSSLVAFTISNILNSKNPKPRYKITLATKILYIFKRILSTATLDKILLRLG